MKNSILGLFVLATISQGHATSILVSDIDDTIKVSHVLDVDSVLANTVALENSFMGMPELYHGLVAFKKADKVVYLSNAPNFVMKKLHQNFLKKGGFPDGDLIMSKGLSNKGHKIEALRQLIRENDPTEMILIGDNGEKDTLIYDQIQNEYPYLKMTTFIHQAYSQIPYRGNTGKLLEKGQIGFATSIDLAAQLLSMGYLSAKVYEDMTLKILPKALAEGNYVARGKAMMFPAWFDCRDFAATKLPSTEKNRNEIAKFQDKLELRCSRGPYAN